MVFKLGMTVELCMAYTLILVSMTMTLMQGHSGSAEAKQTSVELSRQLTKQAISIKLYTTVGPGLFLHDLDFEKCIWFDHLILALCVYGN